MRARVAHAYIAVKKVCQFMPIYANSTLKSQNRHWHKLGRIGLTTPQFYILAVISNYLYITVYKLSAVRNI